MDISGFKQIWDCHTHTVYSGDGKGTIEQNVRSAVEKGLSKIAITDHGFNHMAYGIKREKVEEMRAEIERLKKIYPIEILFGIEANLISLQGDIDLTPEEQKLFDIVLLGIHKSAKPATFGGWFNFALRNLLWDTKKHSQKVTNAYILALQKNRIDIVVHLHNIVHVDAVKIAKEAVKHNTLIELNNKHMLFSEQELWDMANEGASFVIDSDAHVPEGVGNCPNVWEFLKTHNAPLERIVNFKKID